MDRLQTISVVYVLHSTHSVSGASRSFVLMLKELMKRGVKPIVVAPAKEGLAKDIEQEMGIRVEVVNYRHNTLPCFGTAKDCLLFIPRIIARRMMAYRAVCQLEKKFKDVSVDLIHTNSSVVDIGDRLAKRLCKPHVYHFREFADLDFNMHYYPNSAIFHRNMKKYSNAICITKQIQKYHGLDSTNSRVIYNPVDTLCNTVPLTSKKGFFLFAGRVEEAKGLLILLQAYKTYLTKSLQKHSLKIAGKIENENYYNKCVNFIQQNHMEQHVDFLGEIKQVDVLMQEAEAIVVPSHFEAFGRCAAEAMLNGCIVIGNNTAGTKEQFDNGQAYIGEEIGLRYSVIQELEECLLRIDSMPVDLKHSIIKNAFNTVKTLYSTRQNSESIIQYYHDILNIS